MSSVFLPSLHILYFLFRMVPSSPLTPRDITEKLSNAETKREERMKLKKENIDEKLATVQNKKEELINEKSNKVKEVK